jgi:hypothetical protein
VRHQQPGAGRDQQAGGRGRDAAENVPHQRRSRVAEEEDANPETDAPRNEQEPRRRGQGTCQASQSRSGAHRDAKHIRARHELGQADDVEKVRFSEPVATFDGDAARPDDAAAKAEEGDGEERDGQRRQRDADSRLSGKHPGAGRIGRSVVRHNGSADADRALRDGLDPVGLTRSTCIGPVG